MFGIICFCPTYEGPILCRVLQFPRTNPSSLFRCLSGILPSWDPHLLGSTSSPWAYCFICTISCAMGFQYSSFGTLGINCHGFFFDLGILESISPSMPSSLYSVWKTQCLIQVCFLNFRKTFYQHSSLQDCVLIL